jgi:hypothetical protein
MSVLGWIEDHSDGKLLNQASSNEVDFASHWPVASDLLVDSMNVIPVLTRGQCVQSNGRSRELAQSKTQHSGPTDTVGCNGLS